MTRPTTDRTDLGFYTPTEAARLTGISAQTIRRWVYGIDYGPPGGPRPAPLWKSQPLVEEGRVLLGFRDMMEARAVHAFIAGGIVSSRKMRRFMEMACKWVEDARPLSTRLFQTKGEAVLRKCGEEFCVMRSGERYADNRRTFAQVAESLMEDVDYFEDSPSPPRWWWVMGREKGIVIDPARNFGGAIDNGSRVPTLALYEYLHGTGQSEESVARDYEVPVDVVSRAVEFERQRRV